MYPTTDSSNRLMDIPPDNRERVAESNAVVCALLRNDDSIVLRSMIRRTRCGLGLGRHLIRANYDALEESIKGVRSRKRSALPDYVTLLDLRQTLPEEGQLFATRFLAAVVSRDTLRKVTLLLVARPSITAPSTRNCHRSRRPALRLMVVWYLSRSWMNVL